jgi:hypothetical protein
MSSWARQGGTGGQGRVASLLSKIPGYSGYKNKESRRDEDRRLREELAREYGQVAQRLADVQGELARARRFAEIGNVERVERALRRFTDRLRTATYGYGGLFSDRPIDERALDQLQAFDRALGDGLDDLQAGAGAVETAAREGGDLAGAIRTVEGTINELQRRFDLRGQVLESGEPQSGPAVDELFHRPQDEQAHVAGDLHFGDAVTIAATDYLVQGRLEFHAGDQAWRQYLLRDGQAEHYLHVPPSTQEPMALLERSDEWPGEGTGGQQATVGGASYSLVASGPASAELVGEGGRSQRALTYRRYAGESGAILFAYDWGGERQALVGRALDPLEVEVYSRP